jgi:hypothetical protein
MPSSGMLRRVALVRTDVSKKRTVSNIKIITINGLETTLTLRQRSSVASYCYYCYLFTDSFHLDDEGATFLRNVDSYKSHME